MRTRLWLANRVFIGAAALFIGIGVWVFDFQPNCRPLYTRARLEYQSGRYAEAWSLLDRAERIAPDDQRVLTLLGWTHLKLRHLQQARQYFERARGVAPSDQAEIGLAAVAAQSGQGTVDLSNLERVRQRDPADPDVNYLLAGFYVERGANVDAISAYRNLLDNAGYGEAASTALESITGVDPSREAVPQSLTTAERPATLQLNYRAADNAMWRASAEGWKKFYVSGVNLGPGAPGHSPGTPPLDISTYQRWLRLAANMNANVVRVYTLLPPAFYQALRRENESESRLLLYQQIWVGDPPAKNLYDAAFVEDTKSEVRHVIDAIHGQGDIPVRHARGGGLYVSDVAAQVGAILLGREVEPSTAIETNRLNPSKSGYTGQYVSVANANATETWFAEMLDYLVAYETQKYNWQHPVALVNWPPLDPLHHPTETSSAEEVTLRNRRGEHLAEPQGAQDDNDAVAIDEAKFKVKPQFQAGLFASYHVYPYYPDFLIQDRRYLAARDAEGRNPVYGYLKELRERLPYPLVVTEYGVPTSMGVSHQHPYGWNHGGHSESGQAEVLRRLTRAVRESGCAGGVVFELLDEWYKQDWLSGTFETPRERANLWLNELDPEKRFGVVGFRTSGSRLFTGADADWNSRPIMRASDGRLQLRAASDEAFLYLRLDAICVSCLGDERAYAIAIGTARGSSGLQQMPFGVNIANGANFLLVIDGRKSARLLIADNYYPYGEHFEERAGFSTSVQRSGTFREMIVETNRERFARDGTITRSRRWDRSPLRYGNDTPGSVNFNSLANWYIDEAKDAALVRIPWGALLVTDPSSRQVFKGFDRNGGTLVMTSPGIDLSVFALRNDGGDLQTMKVLSGSPQPANFTWAPWDHVRPELYLKKSYYALQKEFAHENAMAAGPVSRRDRRIAPVLRARLGSVP